MSTQLQITCIPLDWDASTLTAVGVPCNGRTMIPQTITARDLPDALRAVWGAAVEQFRSLDPGGWAASHVVATKSSIVTVPAQDNPADTIMDAFAAARNNEAGADVLNAVTVLGFSVSRTWDDGTTDDPIHLQLDDPHMIAFFDALTSPDFWTEKS